MPKVPVGDVCETCYALASDGHADWCLESPDYGPVIEDWYNEDDPPSEADFNYWPEQDDDEWPF